MNFEYEAFTAKQRSQFSLLSLYTVTYMQFAQSKTSNW